MKKIKTLQKTALITGGGKRIGKAIALKLAHRGFTIALHYNHSRLAAQTTAAQITKNGGICKLFSCDLSNEKAVSALLQKVRKKLTPPELLINNASLFEKSKLRTARLKSFNQHMAINLKAPFILSRDFANTCKKGHIINILDTHITQNQTKHMIYLLSKKALAELTKMSALELAPNIRVNGIAPGLILSPVNVKKGHINRLAKNVPLKKKGEPSQITACIEFLLDNPYLTGQILYNDGGEHLIR